ncbi:MAG: sugar ABC transporter permease [Clostridia bacterium]|nr:sugar ABC transporter permease [Clostridia bacterium]
MVDSKQQWKAWLYLAPAIILLLIFTVWPIINTVRMAFINGFDFSYIAENTKDEKIISIGIRNFADVIRNPFFTNALKNTLILCVLTVPLSTFLALLIAVCLNSIKPLQKLLQTIFFLPYVTNSIAIGMVFAAMFNIVGNVVGNDIHGPLINNPGIINYVLEFLGFDRINWMNNGSSYWANIWVMVIYIVWNALPFKILILLGGLQSVNKQYYDAAKVDSTPKWRVFTKITVPLLSPMLAYVIITGFIGGFKEYSSIVGVFGDILMGPPHDPGRLNTVVGMIYDYIEKRNFGIASAGALILFVIILIVTFINLWVSKKKVHY